MQFKLNVYVGQPLELWHSISSGGSISLKSNVSYILKTSTTTIEFQIPHRKFGIHIEFNPQSQLALLKVVLQSMLVPTAGSFSFYPANFHSFAIHDCGNHYEFYHNNVRVMQGIKCPYRTGLERIEYKAIPHNYLSVFSTPLLMTADSGKATTTSHTLGAVEGLFHQDGIIPSDMDGRDDDEADTKAPPKPYLTPSESSGIDERAGAESTLDLRESILSQREQAAAARERDLAERERKVAEKEQELLFAVRRVSNSGRRNGKADRKLDSNCRNQ